jgi:hypothetical protein
MCAVGCLDPVPSFPEEPEGESYASVVAGVYAIRHAETGRCIVKEGPCSLELRQHPSGAYRIVQVGLTSPPYRCLSTTRAAARGYKAGAYFLGSGECGLDLLRDGRGPRVQTFYMAPVVDSDAVRIRLPGVEPRLCVRTRDAKPELSKPPRLDTVRCKPQSRAQQWRFTVKSPPTPEE